MGLRIAMSCCILVCVFLRDASAADCNSNGIDDTIDLSSGASTDCNADGIPDECAWVTFVRNDDMLAVAPQSITNKTTVQSGDTPHFLGILDGIEADLGWGDLNNDGWVDVVVVRKQPFVTVGKRKNVLLMNEQGILVDRTMQYARSSDTPGDVGFLTPTNDQDVVIVDVNLDGWLDVITATGLGASDPKHITHPRVYINLGNAQDGSWLGLRYEADRFPQLVDFDTASPADPNFIAVAAGDVTGDGYPDLYFSDYDHSLIGVLFETGPDLDDRLLINDGTGRFVDESQTRMTPAMLSSVWGMSASIVDMNLDGAADIVKTESNLGIRIVMNNPASPGNFVNTNGLADMGSWVTDISVADLNNDGLADVVASDDGLDRFRFNLGEVPDGYLDFSGGNLGHPFTFEQGVDGGFAGNNLIADLDNDGWNDVLIADVYPDSPVNSDHLNIYHNLGQAGDEGQQIVLLEHQPCADASSWEGVGGMTMNDLADTYDVAALDLDNDTDLDLILSQREGTFVWENQLIDITCQHDLGMGGPGNAELGICGDGLALGEVSLLELKQAAPTAIVYLLISAMQNEVPFAGGTIVGWPVLIVLTTSTDETGELAFLVPGADTGSVILQAAIVDAQQPQGFALSNALSVQFGSD